MARPAGAKPCPCARDSPVSPSAAPASLRLPQATLTAILISTLRIGTSIDSFYAALKNIAGPEGSGGSATGLAVLDKAQTAVNALRVAQVGRID
jgi:hypothetical protein